MGPKKTESGRWLLPDSVSLGPPLVAFDVGMSSKRKPEPAKPEATTTTRRVGQRTRLQPLAWWSNERKNYEASENGPVLTGVLSPGEGKIKPLTGSSPSPPLGWSLAPPSDGRCIRSASP